MFFSFPLFCVCLFPSLPFVLPPNAFLLSCSCLPSFLQMLSLLPPNAFPSFLTLLYFRILSFFFLLPSCVSLSAFLRFPLFLQSFAFHPPNPLFHSPPFLLRLPSSVLIPSLLLPPFICSFLWLFQFLSRLRFVPSYSSLARYVRFLLPFPPPFGINACPTMLG